MSEETKTQLLSRGLGIYVLAGLLFGVGVLTSGCGDSGSENPTAGTARKGPEAVSRESLTLPLDLALFISPGAEPGQAVALIRLYSHSARQKALDNRMRPEEQQEKIDPYSLEGGAELWARKLIFEVQTSTGDQSFELSPAGGACKVMGYPKAETLFFGHDNSYSAVYRLESPDKIIPGSTIRAVLNAAGQKIVSNERVVPPPAAGTEQAALRRARNARWLGNADAMLAAGRQLAKEKPRSMTGYWYQGLAWEKMGKDQEALESYRQAWNMWRKAVKDPGTAEPPMRLARRIARIQSRLGILGKTLQ
jgi:hypothetical protein